MQYWKLLKRFWFAWTHQKPLVWVEYSQNCWKIAQKSLCNLAILSIKQFLFPDELKIAKLKLLFEKGYKSDPKNYRPTSLLPVVSMITEKAIHIQTQEYLE